METKHIWVITNNNGQFIKAVETRETAKKMMEEWRESYVKVGLFGEISKLDAVYSYKIEFIVTFRDGKKGVFTAKETVLF